MKIKKRYIWVPLTILLLGNILLGGIVIDYHGKSYKIITMAAKGDIYPMLSVKRNLHEFELPFTFLTSIWLSEPNEVSLLSRFVGSKIETDKTLYPSFTNPYSAQKELESIDHVIVKSAYIKQVNAQSEYDLLSQYPEDKRIFYASPHISLPFDIADGDICCFEGIIYLSDGSQIDFSTKNEVQKDASWWHISFYFLERME